MKRLRLSLALSVTLLYAISSILWIVVSDLLIHALVPDPPWHNYLTTAKGWAFVLVTSILLYSALRGVLRERERVMHDLEQANAHLEAYARQQEAISSLRQHALSGTQSRHLFDEAVSLIALTLNVEYTSLLEPQPDGQALLLRAGVGWSNSMVGNVTIPATAALVTQYHQTWPNVLVIEDIHDLHTAPGFPDYAHLSKKTACPITSSMSVALVGHEQPIGILGAHTEKQQSFPDDERRFLAAMANVLATAIQREQTERQLQQVNRALKTMMACNQALIHATNEIELLQHVCRIIVEVGEYELAWVSFAAHDAEKRVYPVVSAGVDDGFLDQLALTWAENERGRGPTGTALRVCQPCIVRNIRTDPEYAPWRSEAIKRGFASSIALPLCICMSSSYEPEKQPQLYHADAPACLAALTICATEPDAFNAEEVAHLKELVADLDYGVRALRTQESLRESEERFRTLVESMDDIIFTLDTEQRHTGVFGRWLTTYGLTEEMFLGKTSYDINPETAHLHEAANTRALVGEHVVYEWSTGDPPTYIQTWVSPVYNAEDTITGLVGVGRDITPIKQSELALRKSNKLLETVLSSLNEAVLLVNPHSCLVYDCNRTTETMFGYTRDEIIGHETDFLHVNHEMFRHFGTIAVQGYEAQGFFVTEYQMRRKDGEVFPTEHFINPLYDEQNTIQMVVSIVRDITERKRAEEDLKRRNQELTALNMVIASVNRSLKLPDIIATLHMLLVDHLNISAGAILLYREADDTLWLETAWGLPAAIMETLEQGELRVFHNDRIVEYPVPVVVYDLHNDPALLPALPDGEKVEHWCYLGIPLLSHGRTQGVVNLFSKEGATYVTDQVAFFVTLGQQVGSAIQNARLFAEVVEGRERLQNLSQQLVQVQEAERQTIASELHDEIGQILTGLNLTLEMVARLPIEHVYPRLDQARTIVNDLMLRVREMSLRLRPPMLDDLGLLPTLLWHFERYTSQTGIQVIFKQARIERRFAAQIETAVYRMVQEALTNVARYAGVTEVAVRLWTRDNMLGVQIEDQGCGFEPEIVLRRHTSSGLSSMHERLRLLGGELIIESAPGAGSCLSVELPLHSGPLQSPPAQN